MFPEIVESLVESPLIECFGHVGVAGRISVVIHWAAELRYMIGFMALAPPLQWVGRQIVLVHRRC